MPELAARPAACSCSESDAMTRPRRSKMAADDRDAHQEVGRRDELLVAVDEASPVPVESVFDLLAHLDDPNRRPS